MYLTISLLITWVFAFLWVTNKSYYFHLAYKFFSFIIMLSMGLSYAIFSKINQPRGSMHKVTLEHTYGTWHHTSPLSFSLSCAVVAWEREYVVKIYTLRKRRRNALLFFFFLREKNGIYKRRYIRIDTTSASYLVLITQNILVLGVRVTLLQAAKGALVKLFLCLTSHKHNHTYSILKCLRDTTTPCRKMWDDVWPMRQVHIYIR